MGAPVLSDRRLLVHINRIPFRPCKRVATLFDISYDYSFRLMGQPELLRSEADYSRTWLARLSSTKTQNTSWRIFLALSRAMIISLAKQKPALSLAANLAISLLLPAGAWILDHIIKEDILETWN